MDLHAIKRKSKQGLVGFSTIDILGQESRACKNYFSAWNSTLHCLATLYQLKDFRLKNNQSKSLDFFHLNSWNFFLALLKKFNCLENPLFIPAKQVNSTRNLNLNLLYQWNLRTFIPNNSFTFVYPQFWPLF